MGKIDSQWEPAIKHRGLSSVLFDDLERWDVGREWVGERFKKEEIHVCWLCLVA